MRSWWVGRDRRVGGEAAFGSGIESGAAGSRASSDSGGIYGAYAGVSIEVSRSRPGNCTDAADSEAVLCVHGIQLHVVCERSGESVQHAGGQAVYVAAAARVGRTLAGVGAAELPAERQRFQGGESRWVRCRLADFVRGFG